jgi:peptidoglycan/LPS O-acetylase OafA/YrhL
MKYRREIDGLRAVAILPVIFFHAGFKAFEGGFVGVDMFFVISGYLITTIILSDMNKGKFSLVTFYERRARRILPALFFVMLCCLPFAWLWLLPSHLKDFSESLTGISAFSSNILFWKESGYFGTAAELKPLLHTWSLSVEEQYYVLFPLFLMVLWELRKRWIFGSLMVVAILSLMVAQWGAYNMPSATFFLLPTRGWELAIGALIAFYFLYKKEQSEFVASHKTISGVFGLLGLALICYSIFAFNKSTPFPSLYALLPTVGTALIIIFSTSDTISGRLLSTKTMVGIGLVSYSTYLWHQPLFAFARHRSFSEPSVALLLVLSVISIALAYFSWRYIEMPFRDKKAVSRKKVFNFAVVGSLVFAVIGLVGHIENGFDKRVVSSGMLMTDIEEKLTVFHSISIDCMNEYTLTPECRTSDEPEIVVLGDSYARNLVQGILSSNPQSKVAQMTKNVCGPFFDLAPVTPKYPASWAKSCLEFNSNVREWLKTSKSVKYAVLSSPFSQYYGDNQLLIGDTLYEPNEELLAEYFVSTLKELKDMGIKPIVFSPAPRTGEDIGRCLAKSAFLGEQLESCNFKRDEESENSVDVYKFLRNIESNSRVVYLDEFICDDKGCNASIDGTFIYGDSGHLTKEGVILLGKNMNFYDLIVGNDKHLVSSDY